MKKRAVIYARQSSGADDYSESVEVQIINCRKLASEQHIEVADVFSDLNISGKTYPAGWEELAAADRAFQKWLTSNSSGKSFRRGLGEVMRLLPFLDFIIVDDITRLYRPLSRSYLESAVNQILIEYNVKILQVKGGALDLAQFDQQLVTMLKNQINDEQIAKQRQRSIEVLNRIRDSGMMPTGIKAFALNYDPAGKRYSVDPEKRQVVEFVFREVLAGNTYNNIVREVNRRFAQLFRGCFWEKNLREILRKPIYAGHQYNTSGELIANLQGESIISLQDFLAVQKLVQNKQHNYGRCARNISGSARHWLPLSGLLYCGNCGSRLVAAVEKGKISYFCRSGSLRADHSCRQSRISMYCSKNHITGAVHAIGVVLGTALIERQKKIGDPVFFYKLLEAYRNDCLSNQEYELLLKECIVRIDVYNDYVNVNTVSDRIQLARRIVLRQKGFSLNKLTRLRKKLLAELEKVSRNSENQLLNSSDDTLGKQQSDTLELHKAILPDLFGKNDFSAQKNAKK